MSDLPTGGRTFVIAEAGVNHNGSLDLARELIDAAKACGADAVKFQDFDPEQLVAPGAPKAPYQQGDATDTSDQLEMLRHLALTPTDFVTLFEHCQAAGIEFLASPFSEESAARLVKIGMRSIKVPSGEITNLPYLRSVGSLQRPVILSTGMSWLGEVETAIRALQLAGTTDVTLLHCVSEYPAPPEQINLRAMNTLATAFGLPVGYSDHSPGIEIAVAATALGATVIEKHLTLDNSLPGPDHRASLCPTAFREMVTAIRNVEVALGNGVKAPADCEQPTMRVARRSLVSARPLRAGAQLGPEDVVIKRPGTGIPPAQLGTVVGRRLAVDLEAGQVIEWSSLQ